MKKLFLVTIIVLLLVGTFSLSASAAPGGPKASWGPRAMGMGVFRELNLTLEQQQKILNIRQDFEKDSLILRNDLGKKRDELHQLWTAQTLNQNAIDSKSKEINSLRIQMVAKMKAMQEKIKKVLSADQLKKLEDFQKMPAPGHGRQGGMGRGCWGSYF